MNTATFDELILKDLIAKGFQGDELLNEFKIQRKRVKEAINNMVLDAKAIAEGKLDYETYDVIFNENI